MSSPNLSPDIVDFRCPGCHASMPVVEAEQRIETNYCSTCKLLWFEIGEMAEYLSQDNDLQGFVAVQVSTEPLRCPANCDSLLVPYEYAGADLIAHHCTSCQGILTRADQLIALLRARATPIALPYQPKDTTIKYGLAEMPPLLRFDAWQAHLYPLPIVMAIAWFTVNYIKVIDMTLVSFSSLCFHELGHATVSWLGGIAAVPLPIGYTAYGASRSYLIMVTLFGVFAFCALRGWQVKSRALFVLSMALAGAQIYLSLVIPETKLSEWRVFGGVAGEIVFSGMFLSLFYYPLLPRWRWEVLRYLALVVGACAFLHAWNFWELVWSGQVPLPTGSIFGGAEDKGGDLNRLINEYGWTPQLILSRIRLLVQTFAWSAVGHYCLFLIRR